MTGHLLLLLCLLGCSHIVTCNSTICRLRLTGHNKVAEASVDCDGRINLSFSPAVRVVKSKALEGIETSKTCLVEGCLLSICNTNAVFKSSQVSRVQLQGSLGEKKGIICVLGRSNVTFEGLVVKDSYGSGILARDNAKVFVKNSNFSGGRAAGGAGILVLGYADAIIQGSTLSGNIADGYYAGGGLATAENSTVHLEHSMVTNNSALMAYAGGGIAVVDAAKLVISNSTIINNTAEGGGAGIAIFYNSTLLITNGSAVVNNTGTGTYGGGGLFVSDQSVVTITGGSIVQGNSVVRNSGGGFMVSGQNATLICIGNSTISDNSASVGGAAFIGNGARFIMGDATSKCTIINNISPAGQDINAFRNSQLLFNNTNINMSSDTVVWTRDVCVLGETLLRVLCQVCRPGTYSLNPKNVSCDLCPAAGASCTGGAALIPTAGWWHSSQNSTQFHRCPHTQDVCLYGGECAEGYAGNLCGSCSAGYASSAPFHCTLCGSVTRIWAVYVLVSLLSVSLVAITAHATWRDNQSGSSDLKPSHMLHVVIMLGQYLLLISSIPLDWPKTLETTFRAFGAVFGAFGGQAASLDCVLQSLGQITAIPVAIMRQLATLLAPPAIFVAVIVLNVVWWGCKALLYHLLACITRPSFAAKVSRTMGLQTKPNLVAQLPVTALVVLSVSYPFLVRMSLGFFACIPLDNAHSAVDPYPQYAVANASHGYWVSDMQQACWSGYHIKWALFMGIPCVIVFCIGMPLAIVLWLSAHAEAPESDPAFREKYGLLYRNFRPSRFWFESVLRLLMSAVCAVSAFRYTLGPYYATLLMNGAFGAYCGLHVVLKPYFSSTLSRMQLLAFLCLYFTTYVTLTLFSVDTDAGIDYQQAAGIITVICVVAYILWCIFLFFKHSRQLILQVAKCLLPCIKKPQARVPSHLLESIPTTKDIGQK